jgi:phosphoribosyl 1,2-cyclic phosphate phosphodiesterase
MKVTILGCGAATGCPGVSIGWGACDPNEPRNRRKRASILVEDGEGDATRRLLVDTSPDLRTQLLDVGIDSLNGVLFTHAHADHLHGIDDLRPINRKINAPLDCWMDAQTLQTARERFGYVFEPLSPEVTFHYKPTLIPHVVEPGTAFTAGGFDVLPFEQDHGVMMTLGFRFGRIAYSTDVINLDDAAFAALEGVDVWIIDALGLKPHVTHANLDKSLSWIEKVRPQRAILTHMGVDLDYLTLSKSLPSGVEPAFDGMVINVA